MGAVRRVRALPSKFGRRSGPHQSMALREQPVKVYGPPGPLLSPPVEWIDVLTRDVLAGDGSVQRSQPAHVRRSQPKNRDSRSHFAFDVSVLSVCLCIGGAQYSGF